MYYFGEVLVFVVKYASRVLEIEKKTLLLMENMVQRVKTRKKSTIVNGNS